MSDLLEKTFQDVVDNNNLPQNVSTNTPSVQNNDAVRNFLKEASTNFQEAASFMTQYREKLYLALANAYQYSKDISEEALLEDAKKINPQKSPTIKDTHSRNKLVIEMAYHDTGRDYPNLGDRKKIYTMVLDKLCEKNLTFDEALGLLKKEGIENIARGKEKSSHLTDESKTEDDNGIAKNDDVSKDNNVTEEQKIIMKALFDNRKTNGIKANDCILLVLDGEVRYITREDILKDFEEFLSKKRSSVNGEPYKVLIEAPSD